MGKSVQIKTKATNLSVNEFIESLSEEQKQKDSILLISIMEKLTQEKPKIWGSSIIGFGSRRYQSPATGREVDWFKIGFSPRKANLSLYLMLDQKKKAELLKKLGKHKTGVGCIYINKIKDIDLKILEKMIALALK